MKTYLLENLKSCDPGACATTDSSQKCIYKDMVIAPNYRN
jgi:hypothetical protein